MADALRSHLAELIPSLALAPKPAEPEPTSGTKPATAGRKRPSDAAQSASSKPAASTAPTGAASAAAATDVGAPLHKDQEGKPVKAKERHASKLRVHDGAPAGKSGQQQQQQQKQHQHKREVLSTPKDDASEAKHGKRKHGDGVAEGKHRRHKHHKVEAGAAAEEAAAETAALAAPSGSRAERKKDRKQRQDSMLEKLKARLAGSRFRWLNETLYTVSSDEAVEMFAEEPHLMEVYHEGFREQVQRWPLNPLKLIIRKIKALPPSLVVADFGCGEAELAASIPQRTHSFDLVALNDRVTACNIKNVPLAAGSVDVAVFCLSLMGVDFLDFLREAHRVLKDNGKLLVAEVSSRFESVASFVAALYDLGFNLVEKDDTNEYFVLFEFQKKRPPQMPRPVQLKPCIYKRR